MSDTAASLLRKINGAKDLQSVVHTMKVMAASNIGQYQKSVDALKDYYHTLELGLSVCFKKMGQLPLAAKRKGPAKTIVAVVFGSDQGLVGQFNDVVVDFALATLAALPGKAKVWAVGERVHTRLKEAAQPLLGLFAVPNSIKGISSLVEEILLESHRQFTSDDSTELHLFYNSPASESVYKPICKQLLPLDESFRTMLAELPWPTNNLPEVINTGTATLQALLGEYLFISLFRACAESLASENASRLGAMQRADKNIDELLDLLDGKYHRLRQRAIDEELFDVTSGFEALKAAHEKHKKIH